MGHNISAVAGVKSPNFYEQGNAINEIWVDDVELISRLPFGDSDLGQAGWPKGGWPKIPWHQFIIPLKRNLSHNITMSARDVNVPTSEGLCLCPVSYPKTGYLGFYNDSFPEIGEFLACMLVTLAIWLTASVYFSMSWNRFCRDLEGLMPNHLKTDKSVVDIPSQLKDNRQARNLIIRWCIWKFLVLGVAVILIVLAYPATVVVVQNGNEQAPATWFARYIISSLAGMGLATAIFCIVYVCLFWRAFRGRRMLEEAHRGPEIVTIPVATMPGTNIWTIALLAREISSV